MPPDSPHGFRSADERWAAIKRTQKRMSAPPGGEDIGALLAQSMDAYWAQREREVQAEMEREAPKVFRRAAALFRDDFWSDFVLASAPGLLMLVTYLILRKAGVLLPDWFPWVISALVLVLLVTLFVPLRRYMVWLQHSGGALIAGLAMSVIGGFTIFHQMQVSNDLTLLALQDELTRIAVSSLRSKLDEGTFLQTRVKDRLLYVKTAEISNQQAVYRASAINFPGELVARLGARSGLVRWTTRNQDSLRFALVSGKLIAVEDGSWVFRTEGRDLQLKAESRVLGLQPVPGGCLVVAYNPMDRTVERALPFDACPDEIINANKAEDSTKSNRRQQR